MSRDPSELNLTEQVNSRATKPDESRKKSLYFLLLAIGRQRAVSNPNLRKEYREALNSLEINSIDESWKVSLMVEGKEITRNIVRNEFKFYSTGLTQNIDHMVESNKLKANSFWDSFESEFILHSNPVLYKKPSLITRVSKLKFVTITQTLYVVCILVAATPTSIKILPYLCLAFFPIMRLFWQSSRKILYVLLFVSLIIFFALTIDFELVNNINKDKSLLPVFLIFLLWSESYRFRYQAAKNYLKSFLSVLLVVGITIFCILTPSNFYFYMSTCLLIVLSEALQLLRRRSIHHSNIVVLASAFEIVASFVLGIFLFEFGLNAIGLSSIELLFFISTYLCWFIYLNIFERYPLTFRAFYPFLLLQAITSQNYNLGIVSATLIIMSIVVISSAYENSKSQKYE